MTKDWAPLQEDICSLYHVQNKPLAEVMRIVQGKHGFKASERSYRAQMQKWGYMKYNTQRFQKPKIPLVAQHSKRRPPTKSAAHQAVESRVRQIANDPLMSTDTAGGNVVFFEDRNSALNTNPLGSYPTFDQALTTALPNFGFASPVHVEDGKSELHRAIIAEDAEQVNAILAAGAAIDLVDNFGNQPLHYAAMSTSVRTVNLLLRYGADVNTKGQSGRLPLHMALPQLKIVETLLNEAVDVSSQDDRGNTPLHLAISMESGEETPVTERLLKAWPDVNITNENGISSFHKLLDREVTQSTLVLTCLNLGADVSAPFPDGRSPLQVFLSRSNGWLTGLERKVVRRFLEKGSSPATLMTPGEPLIAYSFRELYSRWSTDTALAEVLCELNDLKDTSITFKDGNSFLHQVTALNRPPYRRLYDPMAQKRLVDILLRKGADPNERNNAGENPLLRMLNTTKRNDGPNILPTMRSLFLHGANIWLRDLKDNCAFFEAVRKFSDSSIDTLKAMLESDLAPHGKGISADDFDRRMIRSECWPELQQAAETESWAEAKRFILAPSMSMPKDVEKRVKAIVFTVLAEKHIRLSRDKLWSHDDVIQARRRQVAGILRDCRTHDVVVDICYYDELLELCD